MGLSERLSERLRDMLKLVGRRSRETKGPKSPGALTVERIGLTG
jgi:hypothetical protein